ncbi:MAG TPA: glycine oxidase ThiO [Solirubrobacteraceae bacterium]
MTKPTESFDVAVVGGGAVGLGVAWRAAQRGLRVVVLERGEPGGGTSHLAAGMIAPVAEAVPIEQRLLRLNLASARMYPAFIEELAEASGRDPGYRQSGTLLVARDGDEAEALERELAMRRRLELGVERLRASEARRLEPGLAPTLRLALEVPDDHAVDPRKLTEALTSAVLRAGGAVRTHTEVTGLLRAGDHVTGVRVHDGTTVDADAVVIAAGAWSERIDDVPPEARVGVRPVKGQIMRLRDPAGPGLLTRVVRVQSWYLVPRGDGRYVLGATMEERGFDQTVTAGATFELLREASELVPGISELVIDELSAGLRPATVDNSPAIGPSALPGLHYAVGHYRHGILLTPITAEIVVGALAGSEPSSLANEFSPRRFGAAPAEVRG